MSSAGRSAPLIAVVDDELAIRRAIRRLVESAGYAVACYSSGPDLLDDLSTNPPSCIVLDLHMPECNGFEVQEALVRGGYDIPVIIVSAAYSQDAIARATKLGAIICLPKPFDAGVLLEAIGNALGI